MNVIGYTENGSIRVILDGDETESVVPDDMGNRDRQMIAEMENRGFVIPPFSKPSPTASSVDAERDKRIADGFIYNGKLFQARQFDLDNIRSMATAASVKIVQGAQDGDYRWFDPDNDFQWIAADNSRVTMSAPEMVEFAMAAASWGSRHIMAGAAIKSMDPIPLDYTANKWWPT